VQGDHASLTWLQEKVNEQQETIEQVRETLETAHENVMTMDFHDQLREAESRHEKQITEMQNELRVLNANMSEIQTELQDMQPRILEAVKKNDQSRVLDPPPRATSQRRKCRSPQSNQYQDDVTKAPASRDRGQESQSARNKISQHYSEYEASKDRSEEPHVDHGDSLSWAMQNWPLTSDEPAASEVPSTSIASGSDPALDVKGAAAKCRWWSGQQASAAPHEQYAAQDGHQSSAISSSHEYHMASGPYYSGPGGGMHGWDSNYDYDFDSADQVLHEARQDIHRLAHQDLGDDEHWPRMSPANEEILRLLRGGGYPPNYMPQGVGEEDHHL